MRKSKLYKHLESVSPDEFERFLSYLQSGLPGQPNKSAIELGEYIFDNFDSLTSDDLDAPELAAALYPDKSTKLQAGNFKRLKSQFLKLLREFFGLEKFSEPSNHLEGDLYLMESLLERGLPDEFEKTLQKTKEKVSKLTTRSSTYFYFQYRMEDLRRRFAEQFTPSGFSFQPFLDAFEQYSIIQKLKYSIFALHLKRVTNTNDTVFMLDQLQAALEGHPFLKDHPVIYIYYLTTKLFEVNPDPDPALFYQVEAEMRLHSHLFEEDEKATLFTLLKEHLIYLARLGKLPMDNSLYERHKFLLKSGWLKNPFIAHYDLKNFISIGLQNGHIDWAKQFLDHLLPSVEEKYRDDLEAFCRGAIAFYEGEWEEARAYLQRANPINDFYYYDIQTLNLRISMHLVDEEGFLATHENIRQKLGRDKKTAQAHKEGYRNFINLAMKLYRIKRKSPKRKAEIREEIDQTQPLPHKEWLLLIWSARYGDI